MRSEKHNLTGIEHVDVAQVSIGNSFVVAGGSTVANCGLITASKLLLEANFSPLACPSKAKQSKVN